MIHQGQRLNFNPRSSCEERHWYSMVFIVFNGDFNPRSSCEERHPSFYKMVNDETIFQSTLLMRGATTNITGAKHGASIISIHAPHARSDSTVSQMRSFTRYFNPRSSCEERRGLLNTHLMRYIFQSTLLMRGATIRRAWRWSMTGNFNPRSSCEERPSTVSQMRSFTRYFNPRSSCEERPGRTDAPERS